MTKLYELGKCVSDISDVLNLIWSRSIVVIFFHVGRKTNEHTNKNNQLRDVPLTSFQRKGSRVEFQFFFLMKILHTLKSANLFNQTKSVEQEDGFWY